MTNWIEPPPQPRGIGCLGKGCLVLAVFIFFLLIACAVGIYFGLQKYSAVAHGLYWAEKMHVLAQEPSPVPQFETTAENMQAAARKWQDFEHASRGNQTAQVELSADDLNNLIARNRRARGKVFVTIESNRLHIQTSVPLSEYVGRNGYYLNGDILMQTDGPQSLDRLPLRSITVNNQPLPSDLLGWKYRSRALGDYVADYRGHVGANSFELRDGKLILETSGR